MTRIAINGAAGRMGRAVAEAVSLFPEITIAHAYDHPDAPNLGQYLNDESKVVLESSQSIAGGDFDVMIEFSLPQSATAALEQCLQNRRAMVVGTTGFDEQQHKKFQSAASQIPLLISPNMSVGVNLCFELLEKMAGTIGKEADIEIIDLHHHHKKDAPSGTALKMGELVANQIGRDLKECAVYTRHQRSKARQSGEIGFHSIRAGDTIGSHQVIFALEGESIELSHHAFSRLAFARGALRAATWLVSQPPGLYTLHDALKT